MNDGFYDYNYFNDACVVIFYNDFVAVLDFDNGGDGAGDMYFY